jgi:hypothetical protein
MITPFEALVIRQFGVMREIQIAQAVEVHIRYRDEGCQFVLKKALLLVHLFLVLCSQVSGKDHRNLLLQFIGAQVVRKHICCKNITRTHELNLHIRP